MSRRFTVQIEKITESKIAKICEDILDVLERYVHIRLPFDARADQTL